MQDGASSPPGIAALQRFAAEQTPALDVVFYPQIQKVDQPLPEAPVGAYLNRLKLGGVKLILDGSPQGKTAYLSKPYLVPPPGKPADYRGYPIYPQAFVDAALARFLPAHVPVIAHANGDAAEDMLIDAVERALALAPGVDHRTVMIHAQTLREDQLDRMRALHMIPSFFSAHTFFWGDWHRDSVLGKERAYRISPTRSALARGLPFTIHNDAPVVPPDAIRLLWATVNRLSRSGDVIGPDQRIGAEDALRALTANGAYQYFEEKTKGSLSVGKQADLVVLSADPRRARPGAPARARRGGDGLARARRVVGAMSQLASRVALVTGASRGIGAAIAERLASAGVRVACVARSLDAPIGSEPGSLRETVARIHAAGGSAVAIQGDVGDAVARAATVEQCRAQLGPIDVLVNNAAAGPFRPFEKLKSTHFALTFGMNVEAALHLAQLVAPHMRAKGRGWIVNISSATAEIPKGPPYNAWEQTGGHHLYGASKAALNRLTAGIAAELASAGIAVNTLAPVAAVITAAVRASGSDKWIQPEMVEPVEAMAEAALALASCDASFTGRVTYSLELLRELGREVRTLDGRATLTAANAQTR